MSCSCKKNGATYLNSIIPVENGTSVATQQQYYLDFTHYLCNNRKICVTGSYPLIASLTYQVKDVSYVGQKTYAATIVYSGQVSYLPYQKGCNPCCDPCPKSDFIFGSFSVPVYSATGVPTVDLDTANQNILVSPANVEDCCNITNAVELETTLIVNVTPPTVVTPPEALSTKTK